jgi:hypothetical protein
MNNRNTTTRYRVRTAALAAAALVAVFSSDANANPVYWDRGGGTNDISTATNWTTDTLPTGSTLGIIDSSIISPPVVVVGGNLTSYNLRQDSGSLSLGSGRTFTNTTLEVKGGTFALGNNRLTLTGTSTVTIDGGNMTRSGINGDVQNGTGTTFNVKSGSADAFQMFNNSGTANFTVNVSGGSLSVVQFNLRGSGTSAAAENSTVLRITGGATQATGLVDTNPTRIWNGGRVEFGPGSGTLSFATVPIFAGAGTESLDTIRGFFNFQEDSGGSLTIAGFTKSLYENWWTATGNSNRLRYNGSNTGSFDDIFQVTGATISLVPEPSTLGLAALGAGLSGIALWRRRRG